VRCDAARPGAARDSTPPSPARGYEPPARVAALLWEVEKAQQRIAAAMQARTEAEGKAVQADLEALEWAADAEYLAAAIALGGEYRQTRLGVLDLGLLGRVGPCSPAGPIGRPFRYRVLQPALQVDQFPGHRR